jgi:hypothetical protein
MPFTVSHVAAVLPLRSRFLLPSGLAIGAMVPDVPLFVPLGDRPTTHSLLGAVTWDLGMGLVLLAVFHLVLKRPLVALCPGVLRDRLAPVADGLTRRRLLWAAVPSLLLGIATHLAWDAFTHLSGPGVQAFPELAAQAGRFPIYRWAQYASGVLGGLAVAVWVWWWLRRAPAVPSPGAPGWVRTTVLTGAAAAAVAGVAVATFVRIPPSAHHHLRYAVTDSMVLVSAWAVLYCLLYLAAGARRARL